MKLPFSPAFGLSLLAVAAANCSSGCAAPMQTVADVKASATGTKKTSAKPEVKPAKAIMVTPDQWFKSQTAPVYRPGHTLPRLTRFGWDLDVETFKVLAEDWNYCLQTNYLSESESVLERFDDPTSREARMMALTLSNPKKYPLAVILSHDEPADQVDAAFLRDADGKLVNNQKIYSPIAPQIAYDQMAEMRARPLRELRKIVPINMILNGGEYGLGVLGFMRQYAEKDPKVMAALQSKEFNGDWFALLSKAKGLETNTIADAVRKAVPDRQLYVYYNSGNTHRNRYGGWSDWAYDSTTLNYSTDLPSNEYYYRHYNSGYLPEAGHNDMLTQALNAVGFQIGNGQKIAYDWLTSGWVNGATEDALWNSTPVVATTAATDAKTVDEYKLANNNVAALVDPNAGVLSPMDLYTGFLKCLFTTGTVGGNAGYYDLPTGGFNASFAAEKPRQWAIQMARLSHVQALFSYVEDDLRKGDLVPRGAFTAAELTPVYDAGINQTNPVYKGKYFPTNGHRWSKSQPAYELPTVANDYPNVRIVARKTTIGKSSRWLVTAWAANGKEKKVNVMLPEVGKIALLARAAGSVYRVRVKDGKPLVILLDPEAMTPTSDKATLAILQKIAGVKSAQQTK